MRKLRSTFGLCLLFILFCKTSFGQTPDTFQSPKVSGSIPSYVKSTVGVLREAPNAKAKKIMNVPQYSKVYILEKPANGYVKVDFQGTVGYILNEYIDLPMNSFGSTQQKESVAPSPTGTSSTSSARTYHYGSRGGCYYINSNGNKTYVHRSFCD